MLLVLNGDIMGISGIVSNSLGNPIGSYKNPKSHWRWIYLASFSLAVNTYVNFLTPAVALSDDRSSAGDVPIPSILGHVLGGFVVGVGTKICNGCTTGHGKTVLLRPTFGLVKQVSQPNFIHFFDSRQKEFVELAGSVLAV